MNKLYIALFIFGGVSVFLTTIVLMGMSDDVVVISDSDRATSYIPSDITKANPNFIIKNSQELLTTTDIQKMQDEIDSTLTGTVLSIDEPIVYVVPGTYSPLFAQNEIKGFIPITVSVEKVYKGNLKDKTFTFYVVSSKYGDDYHISSHAPNFEVGEKILVHLTHWNPIPEIFPDGYYYVKLGTFGKYQLQTDASNNAFAFNDKNPNGISLDSIVGKSLP